MIRIALAKLYCSCCHTTSVAVCSNVIVTGRLRTIVLVGQALLLHRRDIPITSDTSSDLGMKNN